MSRLQGPHQYRRVLFFLLNVFISLRQLLANARIAGMATDLNLIGLRYNTAAAVFFVRIFILFACLKYGQV